MKIIINTQWACLIVSVVLTLAGTLPELAILCTLSAMAMFGLGLASPNYNAHRRSFIIPRVYLCRRPEDVVCLLALLLPVRPYANTQPEELQSQTYVDTTMWLIVVIMTSYFMGHIYKVMITKSTH